jgi:hypothetical protein
MVSTEMRVRFISPGRRAWPPSATSCEKSRRASPPGVNTTAARGVACGETEGRHNSFCKQSAAGQPRISLDRWGYAGAAKDVTILRALRCASHGRCARMLTKKPNVVGAWSFGVRQSQAATRGRITCWR